LRFAICILQFAFSGHSVAVCHFISGNGSTSRRTTAMPNPAVIFDVDGVLVDSYQAHFASWRQLYRELGRDYSEAAFASDFGRRSGDILRRTLGEGVTDEQVREWDERKESLFRDLLRENFTPMDGAMELIDALAAGGFLLAVGSSAPPENIELTLEKLGRRARFVAVVAGKDVTRGKPDPQVFQLAAQRLGASPQQCAVVEDAVHGIEAAQQAGMVGIALTGTASRAQLAKADLIIDSLRELSPAKIRGLVANNNRRL
jgi:beta-phosphoglucomutase